MDKANQNPNLADQNQLNQESISRQENDGCIIETWRLDNNSIKVSAIDVATGVEVSILAPASNQEYANQIAMQKLRYRLKKLE